MKTCRIFQRGDIWLRCLKFLVFFWPVSTSIRGKKRPVFACWNSRLFPMYNVHTVYRGLKIVCAIFISPTALKSSGVFFTRWYIFSVLGWISWLARRAKKSPSPPFFSIAGDLFFFWFSMLQNICAIFRSIQHTIRGNANCIVCNVSYRECRGKDNRVLFSLKNKSEFATVCSLEGKRELFLYEAPIPAWLQQAK